MTQLVCPFCGPRPLEEFLFRKTVPNAGDSAYARTYFRVDHDTHREEQWQHSGGCRVWLRVVRNPSTGAVASMTVEGSAYELR